MKQKKLLRFGIMVLLLFLQVQGIGQEVAKIRIDPDQAHGGTVSEYFEQVEYIPLETTKESLFGEIQSLVITDSSYVFYDHDTKSVYFFRLNGRFIRKVAFSSNAIPYIIFHKLENKVLITTYNSQRKRWTIEKYRKNGIKESQIVEENINQKWFNATPIGNDGSYLIMNGCNLPKQDLDSPNFLLTVYQNGSPYKSFFKTNTYSNPLICQLTGGYPRLTVANDASNSIFVSLAGSYDIYKITKDSAVLNYKLIFPHDRTFPKMSLDQDSPHVGDSLLSSIKRNDKIISKINNVYLTKNNLFFKIDALLYRWTFGSEKNDNYNFIYNLKTGKLSSFERITPDSASYYLPLFENRDIMTRGLNYYNGFFYANISSIKLFSAYNATKQRGIEYPSTLNEYFKTKNRKSNPVIIRMKLKE